jgi:hypothetical protein
LADGFFRGRARRAAFTCKIGLREAAGHSLAYGVRNTGGQLTSAAKPATATLAALVPLALPEAPLAVSASVGGISCASKLPPPLSGPASAAAIRGGCQFG